MKLLLRSSASPYKDVWNVLTDRPRENVPLTIYSMWRVSDRGQRIYRIAESYVKHFFEINSLVVLQQFYNENRLLEEEKPAMRRL